VTDDLLPLFGATPLMLGRALVTSEDADDIVVKGVVISHELRRCIAEGGDPDFHQLEPDRRLAETPHLTQ
jgi:hypothetical protein